MTMNDKEPILLAIAILNHNVGHQFVKEAMQLGLSGGLVTPANGLIGSPILNLLSIRHDKRDLVMLFEKESILLPNIKRLVEKFKMTLPNHGIVFIMDTRFKLRRDLPLENNDWNEVDSDYQLVFMSFKHGKASEVIEKIHQVSTAGATIFTGKGEHKIEQQQMMGLKFSPQKDVIMSVVESEQVPDVFTVMENNYVCSNTKGMYLYSLDIHSFSQNKTNQSLRTEAQRELLISIVSEELEEEYIKIMKHHHMNGGTSVKGYGSVAPERMERIFNITVNPQKKILLTIDTTKKIEAAYEEIINHPVMNEAHKGIYFTLPVREVYGLYEVDA